MKQAGRVDLVRELALLAIVLAVAAAVRLPGIFSRSIWYDEAISLLTSSGHAEAPWPDISVPAGEAQKLFVGHVGWREMARDVRRYDVHPPGYYWALGHWRAVFGSSLESSRVFSLICSLAAVLALYLLLRAAEITGALTMTLVYALSTGAVHGGHEARAYALASGLILAAAWLGYRAGELTPRARAACGSGVAVACGLTFHVNYLTLFPAAALLGWFAAVRWRDSRALAVAVPAVALMLVAAGVPTLLEQLDKRPDQLSGFAGLSSELLMLLEVNAQVVGIPLPRGEHPIRAAAALGLFVVLLALTLFEVYRRQEELNRRFWSLVAVLATAPSAGILMLDVVFDKRLHISRYVNLAGPALAVLVSYGLVRIATSERRTVGVLSLASLLAIQASNVNWGMELCPNSEFGSTARSLAGLIRATSSPSHVVMLAEGYNHAGNPGPLIYELDPREVVLSFGNDTDLDQLMAKIAQLDDLWLIFSVDQGTLAVEEKLLRRLESSGLYRGLLRHGLAFHLARVGAGTADPPG